MIPEILVICAFSKHKQALSTIARIFLAQVGSMTDLSSFKL